MMNSADKNVDLIFNFYLKSRICQNILTGIELLLILLALREYPFTPPLFVATVPLAQELNKAIRIVKKSLKNVVSVAR